MLKGLCVRAEKITSTRKAFKDAVVQCAEGLLLRGYTRTMLLRSWQSYLHEYFGQQPSEKRALAEWFDMWIDVCFKEAPVASNPHNAQRTKRSYVMMLCALDAVNAVMEAFSQPGFAKTEFDLINGKCRKPRRILLLEPRSQG